MTSICLTFRISLKSLLKLNKIYITKIQRTKIHKKKTKRALIASKTLVIRQAKIQIPLKTILMPKSKSCLMATPGKKLPLLSNPHLNLERRRSNQA